MTAGDCKSLVRHPRYCARRHRHEKRDNRDSHLQEIPNRGKIEDEHGPTAALAREIGAEN